MKIGRSSIYEPITMTLETEEEADAMWMLLNCSEHIRKEVHTIQPVELVHSNPPVFPFERWNRMIEKWWMQFNCGHRPRVVPERDFG